MTPNQVVRAILNLLATVEFIDMDGKPPLWGWKMAER